MRVARTRWPAGINESVVNVLLSRVDDLLNVNVGIVKPELTDAAGVPAREARVGATDRRQDIQHQ